MRRTTVIFCFLTLLFATAAGCDDDPAILKRPRLTGIMYVSARADRSDPAVAILEITNLGSAPLEGIGVSVMADDLPPVEDLSLASSETKQVIRLRPHDASHPTEIWVTCKGYQLEVFFVGRESSGGLVLSEDGYGGRKGAAEFVMRHLARAAASKRRWGLAYGVMKVVGAVFAAIAVLAVTYIAGKRRSGIREFR